MQNFFILHSLSHMDVDNTSHSTSQRKAVTAHLVMPGEVITEDPTSMRGHGTYLLDGKIVASVAGIVERIGKLVSVRALKSRCVKFLVGMLFLGLNWLSFDEALLFSLFWSLTPFFGC